MLAYHYFNDMIIVRNRMLLTATKPRYDISRFSFPFSFINNHHPLRNNYGYILNCQRKFSSDDSTLPLNHEFSSHIRKLNKYGNFLSALMYSKNKRNIEHLTILFPILISRSNYLRSSRKTVLLSFVLLQRCREEI